MRRSLSPPCVLIHAFGTPVFENAFFGSRAEGMRTVTVSEWLFTASVRESGAKTRSCPVAFVRRTRSASLLKTIL